MAFDWTGSSSNSGGGGDWVSTLFQVGGALLGQQQAKEANESAREQSQQATERAAATSRQASDQARDAITSGNASANARLARIEAQGQPGVDTHDNSG